MLKQLPKLEYRLSQEASNLRKQAEGMREGIYRDELLRKANQMGVAIQVNYWQQVPAPVPPGSGLRPTRSAMGRFS
ncbi:hypothetical protein [Bradyrhizobium sp. STM 3557]|uniref:hypothetical protein n=1 Tax=Bradyrhizobium sp. STM 3557 TaxID=578920 RepID=UPI00388D9AA4